MTDRYSSLTVVLEQDIRSDDAEGLIKAIEQMRGVLKVTGTVSDYRDLVAQTRARTELGKQLWAVLYPERE